SPTSHRLRFPSWPPRQSRKKQRAESTRLQTFCLSPLLLMYARFANRSIKKLQKFRDFSQQIAVIGGNAFYNWRQDIEGFGEKAKWRRTSNYIAVFASLIILQMLGAMASAQILPPGETPTKLATGFVFTESPLYDHNGGVYFEDMHPSGQVATNPSHIVRYD